MREQPGLGIVGVTKVGGFGSGLNGFLRGGEKMPAGIRFRAAEMNQRLLFLFRSHLRRITGIEADENNFVVAPGIEREHTQHADNALLDLLAKHRAAVIDEGQNHGLLPEIVAKLNAAAGFVAEREIQRHGPVERRLESNGLQSAWHGRGWWAGIAWNCLRVQWAPSQKEDCHTGEMFDSIHDVISFSPSQALDPRAN